MKIKSSKIQKFRVTGINDLDAVDIFVEDFHAGAGEVTIKCWGKSWSHYWSHMGEGSTLMSFFIDCDNCYIAGKLSSGTSATILDRDEDVLSRHLKDGIIENRKEDIFSKEEARSYWSQVDEMAEEISHDVANFWEEIYCAVLGDEPWYDLPEKPNPDYEYLVRIISTVKQCFKELIEGKS